MGEPVIIRIETVADTRGIQETQAAMQGMVSGGGGGSSGIVTAYGEIGVAAQTMGAGVKGAGDESAEAAAKFEVTRAQAARLAQTMAMAGVIPHQLAAAMRMLISGALNPATLGFAAAILAVQGLIAAYRSLAAETEKQNERARETTKSWIEASQALETYIHVVGRLTSEGAESARRNQLLMAEAGGMKPEDALKLMEASGKAGISDEDLPLLGQAWAGRTRAGGVPKKAMEDMESFTRWFKRRRPAAERLAVAGAKAVAEIPGMRESAMVARVTQEAEAEIDPRKRVAREMAMVLGMSQDEAFELITKAEPLSPAMAALEKAGTFAWPGRVRMQEFLRRRGRMDAYQAGVINIGTYLHNNFAGADAPPLATDGRPRGPRE